MMNTIDISTGQHVTILYRPAGAIERAVATVLDWAIQYFYFMLLFMLFAILSTNDPLFFYEYTDLKIVILILSLIPVAFYNFLFEAFMRGQTPGKMLLKIRITNLDGSTTSTGSHFLRWLIRPVDFLPFLGILGGIFIGNTKNKQRIGDLAAGTIVVKTNQRVNINAEYYEFDDDYTPLYPQVEKLSEAQIRFIIKHLELPEKWNLQNIEDLAGKVKNTLEINSDLRNRDFLVRIVKDYNYYASC
ncbi:MAG: RDD family protein [Dysgonamonadaceae bacterium]|jgi:uncharacterized RDD family membrane protein YckC|nr:RDD family protein [Dysgonamonadaceae bacterium]